MLETLFFSSGSLEFWYMLGRGRLCVKLPLKTRGAEFLMSFCGR